VIAIGRGYKVKKTIDTITNSYASRTPDAAWDRFVAAVPSYHKLCLSAAQPDRRNAARPRNSNSAHSMSRMRPAADEIGIASEMMDARLEELMHFGTACADRVVAVYALMVKARHVARSAVVGAKDAQAAPWTGHW
jgi:hypothetical protein